MTIYTKHKDSKHAYKLTFDNDCEIANKTRIEKQNPGTTIEVRDIHRINNRAKFSYMKFVKEHNEGASRMMSIYSMILWNRSLSLTFQ